MKLSFLHFLAAVATVVDGTGGLRSTNRIEDAVDVPHGAIASDTTNPLLNTEHQRELLTKKQKKKLKKKKKNKDKDDDDDKDGGGSGGKRLQMYCKTSFEWQGKSKCPDYCLTYSGCKEGASIRIKKCGGSNQKWKKDNGGLRPAGCSGSLSLGDGKLKRETTKVGGAGSGTFEITKSGKW